MTNSLKANNFNHIQLLSANKIAVFRFLFDFIVSKRVLSERFLKGVDIPYKLYIYHMVVLSFILEMGSYAHNYTTYLIFNIASVALGYLAWQLKETHALRFKTKKTAQ